MLLTEGAMGPGEHGEHINIGVRAPSNRDYRVRVNC